MTTADHLPRSKDHQLPHPKRPLDPLRYPFVGNQSVDDNLREMVQAALWGTLGERARALSVDISGTVVTLSGTLETDRERQQAVAAARSIRGIASIADRIDVRHAGDVPSEPEASPARMICLRRFCSMDEASTSAAIRQAAAELDALFVDAGTLPQTLVVIYSNILDGTVTLDIGMPCSNPPPLAAGTEVRIAQVPVTGTRAETTAAAGFDGFVAACRKLARADRADHHPGLLFWQKFDAPDFRPWSGHPQTKVYLAE